MTKLPLGLDRLAADVAHRVQDLPGIVDHVACVHDLLSAGVTPGFLRAQLTSGRWRRTGHLGIALHGGELSERGRWWAALFDAGPRAALDGVTALKAAGLENFDIDTIRISVPRGVPVRRHEGATIRQTRRLQPTDLVRGGLPRVRPEIAAIRAALWSRTNKQAATILMMTVQQRLCRPIDLAHALLAVKRDKRRKFLEGVVGEALGGAEALGELDFARLCRQHGLPIPDRQVLRHSSDGTAYLDAYWPAFRVVAEIDGIHHAWAHVVVADARRQNDLALARDTVIRIPVLALHVEPAVFMEQLRRALVAGGWQSSVAS